MPPSQMLPVRVRAWLIRAACVLAAASGLPFAGRACEVDHEVVFVGLDWDSNAFHTAVAQRILRDATAYPVVEVRIGASKAFLDGAPQIRGFLQRYRTSAALVSEALAYMQRTQGSADDAARHFLKTHMELWTSWVMPEVAARVRAAL